jgi:hypothetical protein
MEEHADAIAVEGAVGECEGAGGVSRAAAVEAEQERVGDGEGSPQDRTPV